MTVMTIEEKVKSIKENTNYTRLNIQEQIYEMEYNLEMAKATG